MKSSTQFGPRQSVDVISVDGETGFYGHRFMSRAQSTIHDFLVVRKIEDGTLDEADKRGYVHAVILMTFPSEASCGHIRDTLECRISLERAHHPDDEYCVLTTDARWAKEDSLFTE